MHLVFICPETKSVFETDRYSMVKNKGIRQDEHGEKFLDAWVQLEMPCPFCNKRHEYPVSELACPFTGNSG